MEWAIKLRERSGVTGLLHRLTSNQGLVTAHNLALDIAASLSPDSAYEVVFIDTDVEVYEEGWLSTVRGWADRNPMVGIVGLEHSAGEVCSPAIFLDKAGYWYIQKGQTMTRQPVEGESAGLGFALLRWDILCAGLRFDPRYIWYYKQDDDFCFQVRCGGYKIWAYPVGNTHYGSASLKKVGYKVAGAGCENKADWDDLKRRNQERFAEKWAWALRGRRASLEVEQEHLREMKVVMAQRREDA